MHKPPPFPPPPYNQARKSMFIILVHTYFASYADVNTPYTVNENAAEVIRALEQIFKRLLKWFKDNKVKSNLILSGKENREINVGNIVIKNSQIKSS